MSPRIFTLMTLTLYFWTMSIVMAIKGSQSFDWTVICGLICYVGWTILAEMNDKER